MMITIITDIASISAARKPACTSWQPSCRKWEDVVIWARSPGKVEADFFPQTGRSRRQQSCTCATFEKRNALRFCSTMVGDGCNLRGPLPTEGKTKILTFCKFAKGVTGRPQTKVRTCARNEKGRPPLGTPSCRRSDRLPDYLDL